MVFNSWFETPKIDNSRFISLKDLGPTELERI